MDNNNIAEQQKALKGQEALSVLLFKLVYNSLYVFLLYVLANLFIEVGYFEMYLYYLITHGAVNILKMIKRRWK